MQKEIVFKDFLLLVLVEDIIMLNIHVKAAYSVTLNIFRKKFFPF